MRIGELAARVGVTTDTVRFYERAGWLPRPDRRANAYRDYAEADVEHLGLLIELRRLDIPLQDAARIAAWCHAGHCGDTTAELPALIARRRAELAERMAAMRAIDARLEALQGHLSRARPALNVLTSGAPCCDVAHAVIGSVRSVCSCCRYEASPAGASPAERIEFIDGPRDGETEARSSLPPAIRDPGGRYVRSARCADDGAMRYVWKPDGPTT